MALIDALAVAMADLSAGRASVPPRIAAVVPDRDGFLGAMPACAPSGVLMSKLVSVFPHNAGTSLPTHQAVVRHVRPRHGRPAALLDGTAITAAARPRVPRCRRACWPGRTPTVLAILGTGVQARAHADAMCRVRPFREIRVAGRDPAKRRRWRRNWGGPLADVRAAASYRGRSTVRTSPARPRSPSNRSSGGLALPGHARHIVGFNPSRPRDRRRHGRRRARLRGIPRRRPGDVPTGSNDLLTPIRHGVITPEHVHAEIGELLAGPDPAVPRPTRSPSTSPSVSRCRTPPQPRSCLAAAHRRGIGQHITLDLPPAPT